MSSNDKNSLPVVAGIAGQKNYLQSFAMLITTDCWENYVSYSATLK